MLTKKDSAESTADKSVDIGVKCSKCNSSLKYSYKWVGDQQDVLCEDCYKDLAFPF